MEMKEKKALKKRKFKTKTTTSVVDKEETDVFDFLNETLLKKSRFFHNIVFVISILIADCLKRY